MPDEDGHFFVLVRNIDSTEQASIIASRLLCTLVKPLAISHDSLQLSASIGISIYPDNGSNAEILIANAKATMRVARSDGGNKYQLSSRTMKTGSVERLSLEHSLRLALERQEFLLHYQPKVNLETGEITGAEALIRWLRPQIGLVYPAEFLSVATDAGLMPSIGQWVLGAVCKQAQGWIDMGLKPLPISVNISPAEFRSRSFLEDVRNALDSSGLDPHCLEIELTSRFLMQCFESRLSVVVALKEMGVQIALDDFGYNFPSMLLLRKVPIDALKIDQSLIPPLNNTVHDTSMHYAVIKVIRIGNELGKRVSAKGIETQEQFNFLEAQKCAEGQGYYFCPPVTVEGLTKMRGGEDTSSPRKPLLRVARTRDTDLSLQSELQKKNRPA